MDLRLKRLVAIPFAIKTTFFVLIFIFNQVQLSPSQLSMHIAIFLRNRLSGYIDPHLALPSAWQCLHTISPHTRVGSK